MKPTAWYATKPQEWAGIGVSSCGTAPMPPTTGFAVVAVPRHARALDGGIVRLMGLGGRTG